MNPTQPSVRKWRALVRAAFLSVLVPLVTASLAGESRAIQLPSRTDPSSEAETMRAEDLETVRRVLEEEAVRERLGDLGLSPEEANRKLDGLSDAQLHRLAGKIDSLIPGGHIGDEHTLRTILIVLLIFLAAVLIVILV